MSVFKVPLNVTVTAAICKDMKRTSRRKNEGNRDATEAPRPKKHELTASEWKICHEQEEKDVNKNSSASTDLKSL